METAIGEAQRSDLRLIALGLPVVEWVAQASAPCLRSRTKALGAAIEQIAFFK
jgi:hypothetical protein